jgi:hypothetical protein
MSTPWTSAVYGEDHRHTDFAVAELPVLSAAAAAGTFLDPGDVFEFGLDAILDRLESIAR